MRKRSEQPFLDWSVRELGSINPRDADESSNNAEHGKQAQWPDDHRWLFMRVAGGFRLRAAEKVDKYEAKHVESSEECDHNSEHEQRHVSFRRHREDAVFAEESAQWPQPSER